jgi:hypothetical protein
VGDDLTPAPWRIAAASVQGRDHIRSGLPCQDAHRAVIVDDGRGRPALVLVVSDGAGSAPHSDVGSRVTADAFATLCEAHLRESPTPAAWTRVDAEAIVAGIQRSLDDAAAELEVERRQLAATLVGAVVTADGAAFLQIGDGAMVTPSEDDDGWMWIHWPQQGEFANTTFFVTQDADVHQLQFDTTVRRIDSIALFTDGLQSLVLVYADQTVHGSFFDRMVVPVRQSIVDGIDARLSEQLGAYLCSNAVASRSYDDITLVVAARAT